MRERRKFRCAIYTRKSSEEGLEQDFNSLDAQREACEAYVRSQKHEGWTVLPSAYDDGGFSGGSMERPGLQKLLADIASGRIDVVVVYKVDRLTRSIMDFARIVEVLDRQGVFFVSVTQAFNTTSSMGRLTLNVLLSFAQFEREVTGERIRDKIAASKRKGMWMGGFAPIGYEPQNRTLVPNDSDAEAVRTIFQLYLEVRSVDALKAELDRRGITTKVRSDRRALVTGGHPFSRGHLYRILSNPIYIGEIEHKGQRYPGQHPAIVDREMWDEVQAQLARNAHNRLVKAHSKNPSLLAGLLVDPAGEKLLPTHARNNGKRYRYYVSASALKPRRAHAENGSPDQPAPALWRLAASEVETAIIRIILNALRSKAWLLDHVARLDDDLAQRQAIFRRADDLAQQLEAGDPITKRGVALSLVHRVVIGSASLTVRMRPKKIASGAIPDDGTFASSEEDLVTITRPLALRRRGRETRFIIEGERQPDPEPDPALVKALAQAHRWWGDLLNRRYATMRDLAGAYDTDERYVARVVSLAFLPAKLTRDIIEGEQPVDFTLSSYLRKDQAHRLS